MRRLQPWKGMALVLAAVLLGAAVAPADVIHLGGGRRARFWYDPAYAGNYAYFRFVDWLVFPDMGTPPTTSPSSVRLVTKEIAGKLWDTGEIQLKKELWDASNSTFRYEDGTGSAGGVTYVLYRRGKIVVRFKGPLFNAGLGPFEYAQLTVKVGSKEYCGRFYKFIRNAAGNVIFIGATGPCQVECPKGFTCDSFGVVPGFNALDPVSSPGDDGHSTWLRVWDFIAAAGGGNTASNATNGLFYPSLLQLAKSNTTGGDGKAELKMLEPVFYTGANYPAATFEDDVPGKVCMRIWQRAPGWIDCNGGSNADASLTVDSGGPNPPAPPQLTVPAGGSDSGAGAAVLPVNLQYVSLYTKSMEDQTWDRLCNSVDYSSSEVIATAFVTGTGTSTVLNGWGSSLDGSHLEGKGTLSVALAGKPFACAGWGSAGSSLPSIVLPFFALDEPVPPRWPSGVVEDLALALRLELIRPGTCKDGVRNGVESDTDCGGGQCLSCAVGKVCRLNSDCQSGYCRYDGVCVDKKPY